MPRELNPHLRKKLTRRQLPSPPILVEGILSGDRIRLAQAITLVESTRPEHRQLAAEVVEACLPYAGRAQRLGITGVPGVGKSTFIEVLGQHVIEQGHKVAVLAIDPTSQLSGGSILGDKTRMGQLAAHPYAFIRPSPAGSHLGGVAAHTRESIILCEAAGFDLVWVETVGVGQSETAVHSMVDCFLLLLLPGGGDELQGIKRGIVEMADIIAVNKADGPRLPLAREAQRAYQNALRLMPPHPAGWKPQVLLCSAHTGKGISEVWHAVAAFFAQARASGYLDRHRRAQAQQWLYEQVNHELHQLFMSHPKVARLWPQYEHKVVHGRMSALRAAQRLVAAFEGQFNSEEE